jgi:toxin CptA
MSIAVSAVLQPSRLLRLALACWGVAGAGAGAALLSWEPARFHAPVVLAMACLAVAAVAWRLAAQRGNVRRIDISGLGEIRLWVQQSLGGETPQEAAMQLLPGSTIWPSMLVLLLRSGGNASVTIVVLLPDSVPHGQFRKIAAAITWIARRDNKFLEKNKIL